MARINAKSKVKRATVFETAAAKLRSLLAEQPSKPERQLEALASKAGMGVPQVSTVLASKRTDVKLSTLERLAAALNHRIELRFVPIEGDDQ